MEMTSQKNNNSSSEDDSDDDANVPPRQPTTKAKAKPTPTSDDSDSDNEANSKNKNNNNDQDSDSTDTDSEDSDDEDNGAAAARKKQRKRKKERLEQNKGRRQRTNSGAGPFSPDAEFRSFKVFSLASAVFIFITSVIAFQWNCLYAHMCFVTEDPAVPQPQSDYIVPVIAVSLLLGLLSHLLIMSESPNSLLGFGVITLVWSICKYTPLVRHCVDSNSPRTCCLLLFVVFVPPPFFHSRHGIGQYLFWQRRSYRVLGFVERRMGRVTLFQRSDIQVLHRYCCTANKDAIQFKQFGRMCHCTEHLANFSFVVLFVV